MASLGTAFMEVTNLPPGGDDQKRLNDKPHMSWLGYSLFVLLSLVLGVISAFFWMINPFTDLLLILAAPPLRLFGYHPPVQGWSGLGSAMTVGFLWPLTLAPVHWLNYRILQWKTWSFAGLLLFTNVVLTLLVLRAREGS